MRIAVEIVDETDEFVYVKINGVVNQLYKQQARIQLTEAIENVVGRPLSTGEDDWCWDIPEQGKCEREF